MDTRYKPNEATRQQIIEVGTARHDRSRAAGKMDKHGFNTAGKPGAIENDIQAAGAEWAFAAYLGEKWQATIDTFKTVPDHLGADGTEWEVRYTSRPDGGLIVRADDVLSRLYRLVRGSLEAGYEVCGWIRGRQAPIYGSVFSDEDGSHPYWIVRRLNDDEDYVDYLEDQARKARRKTSLDKMDSGRDTADSHWGATNSCRALFFCHYAICIVPNRDMGTEPRKKAIFSAFHRFCE